MAYRLSTAEDAPAAVRAVAREQLDGAITRLEQAGADPVAAIHDARKHLKKARALLRLARPALGEPAYRRENADLRALARRLSGARDADVLILTVERLATRYAGRIASGDFDAVRTALAAEGAQATAGDHAAVITDLRAARARVETWPLERCDWDGLLAGSRRAYARGRAALRSARAKPTTERLHAWRRRVKDLWYHERLLAPLWPAVIGAYAGEARVLSELLGDDHDLALLRARLARGLVLPPAAASAADALAPLIDERRAQLQALAWPLGARLYAERPKARERRLRRYVRAAAGERGDGQPD